MRNNVKTKEFTQINSEISFLIRNKEYDKALTLIEEYLINNYDPYLLVFKAHILLMTSNKNEENNKEAEKILDNVLDDYSISFRTKKYALSELARLALMRNDQLAALDCYKQILDESKFIEPDIRCHIANIYCDLEMFSHGLDVLDVKNFNDAAMNNCRCRILIQQKKYKEAIEALNRPIKIGENNKEAHTNPVKVENEKNYHLGCIYYTYYYDFNAAIKYFQNAIKDNEYNSIYWASIIGLISVYYSDMQFDKCIELCNYFLENSPKNSKRYPRVIKTLVRIYIEKRDYNKGLEIAKKYRFTELELFVKACLKINDYDFILAYELLDQIETRDEGLEIDILFRKLIILFRLKREKEYNMLFDDFMIMSYKSKYMNYEVKSMKMTLEKSNDVISSSELDNYYGRQIVNYSEEEYKKYIKTNFSHKFNKDINLDELMDNIRKQIEEMKPQCSGFYDAYFIKYRNVGVTKDGKFIHNLLIKCLPDTKDIVIILPDDYRNNKNEEKDISSKRIRMSQIEKFNKRYGNI